MVNGKPDCSTPGNWSSLKRQAQRHSSSKAEENRLLNHLKIRNFSILAHGFEPVKAGDWQTIQVWLAQQFIPMLLAETAKTGIKELPVQLPVGFDLR